VLENERKLLVDRHKGDNHPKSVWANDPTLIAPIGPEFVSLWHRVEKESPEFTVNEMRSRGMSSAGSDAVPAAKMVKKEKPKQKVRHGGKVTNTCDGYPQNTYT
jgi:transcription initiation factor TFIIE subunit beta